MIWALFLLAALAAAFLSLRPKPPSLDFLLSVKANGQVATEQSRALNLKTLSQRTLRGRIKQFRDDVILFLRALFLSSKGRFKLLTFFAFSTGAAWGVCYLLPEFPFWLAWLVLSCLGAIAVALISRNRRRRAFEKTFPDALNLLAGAISSGEGLVHAIAFVGESLDGPVGQEFRSMGQSLGVGQPADDVLHQACRRFRYPQFVFFAIALRANIERGGQLRDLIQNLNEIMFSSQTLEKKKAAMTAEARLSAKIVAAIPVIFLVIMKYVTPEDFDFVMFHPDGRGIFCYVLGSELLGGLIIWQLMRRVRG